jgi:hypothetical protein
MIYQTSLRNTIATWFLATSSVIHAQGVLLDSLEVHASADGGLVRDVYVNLKDIHGMPILAAELNVTADMPSMPMAHQIRKVVGRPLKDAGAYVAKIPFEMRGEWAIKIEVVKPLPKTIVRKVIVN